MQKFFLIQVNPRYSRSISGEQWRPQFLSPAPCHCLSEEMRLGSMKFSGVVKNSVAGADFYTLLMPSRPGVNNFRFLSPRWLLNRPGASLVNNGPGVLHSLFFSHCRAVHAIEAVHSKTAGLPPFLRTFVIVGELCSTLTAVLWRK